MTDPPPAEPATPAGDAPSRLTGAERAALRSMGREWSDEARPVVERDSAPTAPDPDLARIEHRGGLPGERYLRVMRPGLQGFELLAPGHLQVTRRGAASASRRGRIAERARRFFLGNPLRSAQAVHERLTKVKALAVLSSDALSSVAYATDQIFLVLALAGFAGLTYGIPIMVAIIVLLGFVVLSYRQTIRAYPNGGGSYIVAKDNLGATYGLVAAAALMTDYVLTVAVSVASGIDAASSAVGWVDGSRVGLSVGLIVLIMVGNLRGIRESGSIFAAPTYVFIASILLLLGVIIARIVAGSIHPATDAEVSRQIHALLGTTKQTAENISIFVVLRAFASGCTALTGVEAISDGVPAFKPPEWRNARATLTVMGAILATMFIGITAVSHHLRLVPTPNSVLISQIAVIAYGHGSPLFGITIAATLLILVLAANTSFSDFPRLLYFLARDDYAPHQFKRLGDRLAFSNGILVLGTLAILLELTFGARTDRLIPLYAVGVFLAFTMSQAGMVSRWITRREPGWRHGLPVNFIGMCLTGSVFVVFGASKLREGAWIVLIIVPMLMAVFRGIHGHYTEINAHVATEVPTCPGRLHPVCVVPVADLHPLALQSLAMARTISSKVFAVHVSDDPGEIALLREKWDAWGNHVPLEVIESPYRSLVRPLLAYIEAIGRQGDDFTVVVLLPELVATRWWHALLHNQTALRLKTALLFRSGTVVVNVPYHLTRHRKVARFRRNRDDLDAL